jgi:hypothetical protein
VTTALRTALCEDLAARIWVPTQTPLTPESRRASTAGGGAGPYNRQVLADYEVHPEAESLGSQEHLGVGCDGGNESAEMSLVGGKELRSVPLPQMTGA